MSTKIVLGLYTGGTAPASFTPNVVNILMDLAEHDMLSGFRCNGTPYIHAESCRVDTNRNKIIFDFLTKTDASHLFILDDDMLHPAPMPRLLASRDKPIITGTYFSRSANGTRVPHAYRLAGQSEDTRDGYGKHVNNFYSPMLPQIVEFYEKFESPDTNEPLIITKEDGSLPSTSVYPIDGAGFGCVLISREALEKMSPPYLHDQMGLNGDFVFYKQARELGIECFVDFSMVATHFSQEHVGLRSFRQYLERVIDEHNTLT